MTQDPERNNRGDASCGLMGRHTFGQRLYRVHADGTFDLQYDRTAVSRYAPSIKFRS